MTANVGPQVLVTGGSGFIGTHLIKKLLSENISVRVLMRPDSSHGNRLDGLAIDIVKGDLGDPEALSRVVKGVNTIIHGGRTDSRDWNEIYRVNIKGTEHLIEAALASNVKRFVLISDIELYDLFAVKPGSPIREDSPLRNGEKGKNDYVYSKLKNEKATFEAYHKGLPATIIRPGMVIGPMGQILFPHLGYRFRDRVFYVVGRGNKILPLTYVENTVDAIYRASIEDKAIGQIYNIVDDGRITVREYLEQLIRTTGKPMQIRRLPYAVPYLAITGYEIVSHAGLVRKGVTSRMQFKRKHTETYFDNTKAKGDLGWEPSVPMKEGLERAFKWYSQNTYR